MGFSFEPEPRTGSARFIAIFIIVVLGLVFLWRQQNNLATQPDANTFLKFDTSPTPTVISETQVITATQGQVSLVYSAVVDEETSPELTADLYLDDAEHPDSPVWEGLMGRTAVETYTVQTGDTLWSIATQYGLSIDTLRWSNPALEHNPDLLVPGTDLIILPVNGVYYTVAEGDNLAKIAEKFGVADADVINYPGNALTEPFTLKSGQTLVIPNGREEAVTLPQPPADLDYPLAWPLLGIITQGYFPDRAENPHYAIDIGAPYGSNVYAADAGTVIHAQWARTGYGFTVIIDHGNGIKTLYAHLKGTFVSNGDIVTRGQLVGAVGSTGNSTGPHVHFEVRENNVRMNPLNYLKPR